MKNKIFLSIETSLNRIFLTLFCKGELFSIEKNVQNSIEIDLNILLKCILEENNVYFNDLDFVIVSLGPGSYTGARVGIAAAKAITLSIEKPLLGFSNFDTLFAQACLKKYINTSHTVGIIIRANKHEIYYQMIDKLKRKEMRVISLEKFLTKNSFPEFVVGNLKVNFNFNKYFYCLPSKKAKLMVFENLYKNYKKGYINLITPYYVGGHYAEKN